MPMYEYQCEQCGYRFDVLQKRSDPPPEACESCAEGPVRKLISAPPVILKGAGFYETEYGRAKHNHPDHKGSPSGSSSSSATSSSSSSSSSDSSGSKSDSKPATAKKSEGSSSSKSGSGSGSAGPKKSQAA